MYLKSPTSEQEMVRNALIFIQLSFFTYLSRSIVLPMFVQLYPKGGLATVLSFFFRQIDAKQ